MISSTVSRVPENTSEEANVAIRARIQEHVAYYAALGPEAINERLADLDREWDIERFLEANAATVALFGLTLGTVVDRRFYILPAAVAGFLLQHAFQGGCPPVEILRHFGMRTASEIDEERYALKALRGDFRDVPAARPTLHSAHVEQALGAVRK
jgi:hypothetical protein